MPTIPEHTETKSSGSTVTFNPNIPVVHSISGNVLEKLGYVKSGLEFKKDGIVITYDGTWWRQNGEKIQFIEDIKNKE